MQSFTTLAPAKINLYLHVTGRREDGYHFLDSLVTFADVGDVLEIEEASGFTFSMNGPQAAGLMAEDSQKNLVVRAAKALSEATGNPLNVRMTLTKNLPIASGIGGGSTDAAAALRLLAKLWGLEKNDPRLYAIAAKLGQDVPCCIEATTCYFKGIGDITEQGPVLPQADMVLVNPNQALPTPAVFKKRTGDFTPAAPLLETPKNAASLAAMLAQRSNGLTDAAILLCPEIQEVLDALGAEPDVLLSRMSGSGATCFGIFPNETAAGNAAQSLQKIKPNWWVAQTRIPRL